MDGLVLKRSIFVLGNRMNVKLEIENVNDSKQTPSELATDAESRGAY